MSSKSQPVYGEPGGGQKRNECGWLTINFIMKYWHMACISENHLHVIARTLERQERELDPTITYLHSTAMGEFSISCIMKALSEVGQSNYFLPNTQLSDHYSLIICYHFHYLALLKINDRWWIYNSRAPNRMIHDVIAYVHQFRDLPGAAVLWFLPFNNQSVSSDNAAVVGSSSVITAATSAAAAAAPPPPPTASVTSTTILSDVTPASSIPCAAAATTTAATTTTTTTTSTTGNNNGGSVAAIHEGNMSSTTSNIQTLRCSACGNIFSNQRGLSLHQSRFCKVLLHPSYITSTTIQQQQQQHEIIHQ
jgi:hypothetical protein